MAVDVKPIGSVGHMVGATLETIGHYLQSQLLDLFLSPFGSSFAVLLWVASAFVAITFFVYTGKSKLTLAFLIGPPLFYLLIGVRTPSQGAEWRFGLRTYEREKVVAAAVETAGVPSDNPARQKAQVSWVFSLYARIVSGLIQPILTVVELISKDGSVSFLTKAERYEKLFRPTVSDGTLKWFISGVIIPNCSDYFMRMRGYLDPNENVLNREEIERVLRARGASTAVTRSDNPAVFEWLTRENLYPFALRQSLTCDELWKVGIEALLPEATKYVETTLQKDLPEGYDPERFRAAIAKKFSTRYVATDGYAVPLTDEQKFILVLNEVAGRMLLSEVKSLQPDLMEHKFGSDAPYYNDGMVYHQQFASRTLRRIFHTDVGKEKGDYLMAMLSLPYIQGILALFLAVIFPFAAAISVIPGKHSTIIFWMGLWLWAKLWDVGFALVMLLDNILFQLFPHGNPISAEVLATPWEAMKSLLEVDPSYSVYTYYHLLATCLAAVPLLTGLFVKRAGGQIIGSVRNSLSTFSGRLGGTVAAYRQAALAQSNVKQLMNDVYSTSERAMANARFDPIVSQARQNAIAAQVDAAVLKTAGLPGPAATAEAAADMYQNVMAERMNYLGKVAYVNATSSEEATLAAVDAIVSNFNSHDLVDRAWTGEEQVAFDKATLSNQIAGSAGGMFAGGLSLTNSLYGKNFTGPGGAQTYLQTIIPGVQGTWNPEEQSNAVYDLFTTGETSHPDREKIKRAYGSGSSASNKGSR